MPELITGNRIFLVCSLHPSIEDALCLAQRGSNDLPYLGSNLKGAVVDNWFAKHAKCRGVAPSVVNPIGLDHFTLAFHRPRDWDCPTPAAPIANAVRRHLVSVDKIPEIGAS